MRILANPALLRAMVVLFCAAFAFLVGILSIRFLRQQIAEESDVAGETPKAMDTLPLHVYNTVIQQLKQQKQELLTQSQAEQQRARANETLNQALLSNLTSGVLVFGPNGLVKSSNPAAKNILGFASVIGMSAEDIFRGAVAQKAQNESQTLAEEPLALATKVHSVLRQGSPREDLRADYETPAGERRFIAVTLSPIQAGDGNLLAAACLINDVTELEEARTRQQSQGAISSDILLQVRTSLNTISDYAQQVVDSEDSEISGQLARNIAHETAQLDRALNGLLKAAAATGAAAGQ